MNRARTIAVQALLRIAAINLHALAIVITGLTGDPRRPPAMSLHLPVETVTQQLRVIDDLMARIRR